MFPEIGCVALPVFCNVISELLVKKAFKSMVEKCLNLDSQNTKCFIILFQNCWRRLRGHHHKMSEFSACEDAGAGSRAAHVIHRGRATGDGTGRTHEGTHQQTAKSRSRMCGSATQCSQVNNRVLSR